MPTKQTREEYLGSFLAAASTPAAIRNRIIAISRERQLPKDEVDKALKANMRTLEEDGTLFKLIVKYDISLDWLLMGDLRGLRRMRRPAYAW
jgi:hypothetical protein